MRAPPEFVEGEDDADGGRSSFVPAVWVEARGHIKKMAGHLILVAVITARDN